MLEDVKHYLRIDGEDDDTIISSLISAAKLFIKNATGVVYTEAHDQDDMYKLALCMLVTHWYENREPIGNAKNLTFSLDAIFLQFKYSEGYSV